MKFFQKRTFKRGLLALTGVGLLAWGAAAFAHRQGFCGHASMDSAEFRARIVAKAGGKLDLDATQKQQLDALVQALAAQRQAMLGSQGETRQALQGLIAGPLFDQAAAQALLDGKTAQLRDQGPALIKSMAAFYDALKPEQQAKLKEMMGRHHHGDRA